MSDALHWLNDRLAAAPVLLRDRMYAAVMQVELATSVHEQLADAARQCLRTALARPAHRAAALDLLAADALLTHACAAAADAGPEELARFSASLDASHFDELLK